MAVAAAVGHSTVRWPWRYRTRQLVWAVIDLVFPPQCAGCGRAGQRFCSDCQQSLEELKAPFCEDCGYPVAQAGRCPACSLSLQRFTALAGLRSAAFHTGSLRKAILQLKYHHDGILADSLATRLLAAGPDEAPAGCLVVPVPLSAERLAARGYNQAELLARAYAELSGLRCAPRAARRVRDTETQVGLSPRQRRLNVANAFGAERRLAGGQPIILVDDVCTTGATLDSCAAALLEAGAAQVWGLTLARARQPGARGDEKHREAGAAAGQAGAVL